MALEPLSVVTRAPYATAFFFIAIFYFILYPLVVYFKDTKGTSLRVFTVNPVGNY